MLHADSRRPPSAPARSALKKSLLLHVAVLGLIIALPYLHLPPKAEPPHVVEAVLVRPDAPAPEPVPTPAPKETPPPVEVPKPEPAPKIKTPETIKETPKVALPKPKPPEKKPESVKPQPEPVKPVPPKPLIKKPALDTHKFDDEARALEKEMQQAEAEQLRRDAEKSATAARNSANQAIVDRYRNLITQRVVTKWNRPLSARNGMVVTLRINMLPGGEVTNVVTTKSSGDAAFDASAEEAVRRASPLPAPEDVTVFNQYFRVITFKFNPADL